MFQNAVPASVAPAFSPTRGSGRGAVVDILGAGVVVLAVLLPPLPEAQAAIENAAATDSRFRNGVITNLYLGLVDGMGPNIFAASMRCIRSISVV